MSEPNDFGMIFVSARLHYHLKIGRPSAMSRRQLAELALEKYGPIRTSLVCRRTLETTPNDLNRWAAKIRHLEQSPGIRSMTDVSARQLCELLGIDVVEYNEFGIDLRDVA